MFANCSFDRVAGKHDKIGFSAIGGLRAFRIELWRTPAHSNEAVDARRTGDGIPYVIPEVFLLFKAKYLRDKDEADFGRVLPELDSTQRSRLRAWLSHVHPGHRWIDAF